METNQKNFLSQQSNKHPTEKSPVSKQEKSTNKAEGLEVNDAKKTPQRRPQFRINENMKRRFY
jgi:hypothetical protein